MKEVDLYIPQKIAFTSLMSCVNYKDIVFVGGIADYINLYGHYDVPINDLDLVFSDLEDLAFVHGYFGLDQTPNNTYKGLCNAHYKVDMDLKISEVRIDFFQKKFKKKHITEGYLFNHPIQFASFDYMRDFHNKEMFRKEVKESPNRLQKHSRKASYYNILSNILQSDGTSFLSKLKELTLGNFILTGGVADNYHINKELNFLNARDLDIIVQDINLFYKLVSYFDMEIGTHSIYIGATKKFNIVQAYGMKGGKRIDLYFNPNPIKTEKVDDFILTSKKQRVREIQEFVDSLNVIKRKNESKLELLK